MKYLKKTTKIILYLCTLLVLVFCFSILTSKFIIETKSSHEVAPKAVAFEKISNNEEIAYQEIDNKAPSTIVFVGGLSGWSGSWVRTMEALNENLGRTYNLIAIDLPPFGYSVVNPEKDFFRSTQAKRINEFLNAKVKGNTILVAHSYGAGPVTEAVLTDGRRVKKLVILDGVLNIDEVRKSNKNPIFQNKNLVEAFISSVAHSDFLMKKELTNFVYIKDHIDDNLTAIYTKPFNVRGTSKKLADWLVDYKSDSLQVASAKSASYKKIKIPVRILWGDKDTVVVPDLAKKFASLIGDSKLYFLKNVGHIPMIEDYQQTDLALLTAIKD